MRNKVDIFVITIVLSIHSFFVSEPNFECASFCLRGIASSRFNTGNTLVWSELTFKQHASVSQGRICSDKFTCCPTEIETAHQTFYLTQSQYTDTAPTSPSADPITPGAWQGSHWRANFEVTGMTRPRKNPVSSGIRAPVE